MAQNGNFFGIAQYTEYQICNCTTFTRGEQDLASKKNDSHILSPDDLPVFIISVCFFVTFGWMDDCGVGVGLGTPRVCYAAIYHNLAISRCIVAFNLRHKAMPLSHNMVSPPPTPSTSRASYRFVHMSVMG